MGHDSVEGATFVDSHVPVNADRSPLGREVDVRLALRMWLIVLALAVVSVGLLQQRVDPNQAFNADRYVAALGLVGVLAVAVWAALRFVFQNPMFPSVVGTAVFVLLFFRWNVFLGFAIRVGATGFVRDVLVVGIASVAAMVLLSRSRRSVVLAGALFAATVGLLGAAVPYVSWALTDPRPIAFVSVDAADGIRDDVLVIALDAYAREDVLLDVMGFDNSGFAAALESRGFVVDQDAMSNYDLSYVSIASMMALEPPVLQGEMDVADYELIRFLLGGGGPLFGSYRDAGYEVTSYLTGWKGSRCTEFIDYCIRRGVVTSTAWYLGEITPIAPILKTSVSRPETSIAIRQLGGLSSDSIEAFDRDRPQLVWAHIELPHPPLLLDAACTPQSDQWRSGLLLNQGDYDLDLRIGAYVEQIKCVNRIVVQQIDDIISAYPDTQILIVSDHGTNALAGESEIGDSMQPQLAESFSVVAAARANQACDGIVDERTISSTVRRFVACTLGAETESGGDGQYLLRGYGSGLSRGSRMIEIESPQP